MYLLRRRFAGGALGRGFAVWVVAIALWGSQSWIVEDSASVFRNKQARRTSSLCHRLYFVQFRRSMRLRTLPVLFAKGGSRPRLVSRA